MRRVTLRGIGPPSRSQDPNLLTPESTEAIDTTAGENITSEDPNEKVGLAGYGEQHLARVDDEFQYVVYFENMPEAGAPAQEVFVTDYLDPDLDWSTFRLTEIAWGDHIISVPENTAGFYTRQTIEDYREEVEKSWWVDVQVALNYETGRVRWIFHTLDPDTGELPMDVFAKMLGHAFESRLDSDYDVLFTVEKSMAQDILYDARRFVDRAERYLREAGVL